MVLYDGLGQIETARSLGLCVLPAPTSPLGYLLYLVGSGSGFRDWYSTEGWNEGPRKLQGFKTVGGDHAVLEARRLGDELEAFPSCSPKEADGLWDDARRRVLYIVGELEPRRVV